MIERFSAMDLRRLNFASRSGEAHALFPEVASNCPSPREGRAMSDEEMIILVQTLLHYLKPEARPAFNDIEKTMHGFKARSTDYSVARSPGENNS